jgi:hypothetical protein
VPGEIAAKGTTGNSRMGRVISVLGRNARTAVAVLVALVIGNAAMQFYQTRTSPLIAWKGGGFGMYTEPHATARAVWITFGSDGAALRLWPETEAMEALERGLPPRSAAHLGALTRAAEDLRYYPRQQQADRLLAMVAQVRWPEAMTGGARPATGATFAASELGLEVTEMRYRLEAGRLDRATIFAAGTEGGQ